MALAPQVTNIGTQGQDARYDSRNTWRLPNGLYTDGTYLYREQGPSVLSENRPNAYMNGLPGANNNGAGGPGVGGGGGGSSAMFSNPYYQQAEAATRAAGAADLAGTRGQLQQLLIAFGLVPEGFQDKLGVLDDTIRALIQKNTDTGISQWARMLEAEGDSIKSIVNAAATSGQRRSGAYGYRLRRNSLNNNRNRSDVLSALLGKIGSEESGFAQREFGRNMSLTQLLASLFAGWNGGGGGGSGGGSSSPVQSAPAPSFTGTPTIGNSNNYYGPAAGTPGGGYTSPKKPLLMS